MFGMFETSCITISFLTSSLVFPRHSQLHPVGCDPHPTLQLVASASLSCILSSLKPEEAAAHLTGLGRLVSDLAAPEAAADLGALLQRAAGQGPGPRGAAGERGADDGAEGNRRATMGASSSSTSGILADCSPSNPESWACRAALLLSTLMKTVSWSRHDLASYVRHAAHIFGNGWIRSG